MANAGDCRAVLCREGRALRLTLDHTPDVACERARLDSVRGIVHQASAAPRLIDTLNNQAGGPLSWGWRAVGRL